MNKCGKFVVEKQNLLAKVGRGRMVLGFKLFRCFLKASGSSLTKAKITKVELFEELLNLFSEIDYLMLLMVGGRAWG